MTYPNPPQPVTGPMKVFWDHLRAYIMALEARIAALEARKCTCTVTNNYYDAESKPAVVTTGTSYTMAAQELAQTHHISVSADITITLPPAYEGAWVDIRNTGSSNVITVSNGTATVGVIDPGGQIHIESTVVSGSAGWSASYPVISAGGVIQNQQGVLVNNSSSGIILKDTASPSHFWLFKVNTAGALTTTDLGTSRTDGTEEIIE